MNKKTLLKLANIIIGAFMIIGGISRTFSSLLNPQMLIISVYIVGFGVLLVAAELKFKEMLKNFQFLENYFGKGLFCIFVGALVY